MRLAVFSDIHGNLTALNAVLADLEQAGDVDLIWCLGDVAFGGPHPAACVAKLRELQEQHGEDKFKVIGGNSDRYLVTGKRPAGATAKDADELQQRRTNLAQRDAVLNWSLDQFTWEDYEFLAKTIGRELRKRAEGYGIVIGYHAIPGDDEPTALRPDSPDEEAADALLDRAGHLAIGGHTHLKMDRAVGQWRVLNPGSVGLSFTDATQAEWMLVTIADGEAQVEFRTVDYDVHAMLDALGEVNYPVPDFWRKHFTKG